MNCAVKEAYVWARGVIMRCALVEVEKARIRDDLLVDDSREGFLDAYELFLGVKLSIYDIESNLQ